MYMIPQAGLSIEVVGIHYSPKLYQVDTSEDLVRHALILVANLPLPMRQ